MLKAFIRWSPRSNTLRRPSWYCDICCLRNAFLTLSGPDSELSLVVDGEPSDSIQQLPWDSVIKLQSVTNSESLLRCLDLAFETCGAMDTVYLVEQDYLHVAEALDVMSDGLALNPEGYVTLFDDPLYYWPSSDVTPVPPTTTLMVGTSRHWRTVPSATMTFAAPAWVLGEDRVLIENELADTIKPSDRVLWSKIRSNGRTIIASIPAAATHVETTALAPLVDWRSLAVGTESKTELPQRDLWLQTLATVSEVAVSNEVPPSAIAHLNDVGVQTIPFNTPDIYTQTAPFWLLITAKEKYKLDAEVRARGTALIGVLVYADPATYSGRWYSGRDWFFADLIDAKDHISNLRKDR